jgi:hypothetical protein
LAELTRLKALLEDHHEWPCDYTFKFVVAREELDAVLGLFPAATPQLRPSKNQNFVGVTFQVNMPSSAAVIDVYERASKIDRLVAL